MNRKDNTVNEWEKYLLMGYRHFLPLSNSTKTTNHGSNATIGPNPKVIINPVRFSRIGGKTDLAIVTVTVNNNAYFNYLYNVSVANPTTSVRITLDKIRNAKTRTVFILYTTTNPIHTLDEGCVIRAVLRISYHTFGHRYQDSVITEHHTTEDINVEIINCNSSAIQ